MPKYCLLDLFPVELLHVLFTYFLAHELLFTFSDVNDYVNDVLLSYSAHRLDFKSIKKTHFDLICRHVQPEQVISLTLSDDDDTPGQSELFLSRFRIEGFTQLRSLTLIKIEFESVIPLLLNLYKLKHLRYFSFDVRTVRYKHSIEIRDYSNESAKLNSLLIVTYHQLLHQLSRLHLNDLPILGLITTQRFQYLRHLTFETNSFMELEIVFKDIPQLQSLDLRLNMKRSNFLFLLPCNQLIRLKLIIDSK